MSTNDLKKAIRDALLSELKKITCALGANATSTYTPTIVSTSTSGTTTDGLYKLRITNTGGPAGTVNGQSLGGGDIIEFEAFVNPLTGTFRTVGSVTYDATGTTFIIEETA